ncbi:tubulin polyglutamylase TTLL11 isoform X2 [Petromyzon marinus]|uniref:tubulin polyglutamylase TTLL11 isoform X2 n=1 Tax=Petromyzon marinus TaxID=7757 RepID=UPI003F7084ED
MTTRRTGTKANIAADVGKLPCTSVTEGARQGRGNVSPSSSSLPPPPPPPSSSSSTPYRHHHHHHRKHNPNTAGDSPRVTVAGDVDDDDDDDDGVDVCNGNSSSNNNNGDNDGDGGGADDDDEAAVTKAREDANKSPKRRKHIVTVDTSKAKTSLEALRASLSQLKWKEYPFGRRQPCDIYWHGTSFHDSENVCSGIVNKFPGMSELVRKVNLSRALRTMQQLFPDEYTFYPGSWILPEEFPLFEADKLREKDPSRKLTFIVKPDSGSQGDGIFLISSPQELHAAGCLRGRPTIVQEYVQRPLLLEKLKFDIRLYVLLSSLEPLEVYVSREGLCRFCTEVYQEPNPKNLHRLYMHLTNYSLNVHSGRFVHSDSASTGSKRTLGSLLGRLAARGLDVHRLWRDLVGLVLKTVLALAPGLRVGHHAEEGRGRRAGGRGGGGPECFQILGFDILLQRNLKPVLLEVNANPSLKIDHDLEVSPGVFDSVSSPVDEEVKVAVVRDALRVVATRIRRSANTASPRRASIENCDVRLRASDIAHEASGRDPKLTGFADDDDDDDDDDGDSEDLGIGGLPPPCLKQVYPRFSRQFSHLRVVERAARLFLRFLGLRGDASLRMGPTEFRTFSRNCKLCTPSISMAYIDILYIDVTRRWNCTALQETGMSFQAFVDAFRQVAGRRFPSLPLSLQVEALVELCEGRIENASRRRGPAQPQPQPPPPPPHPPPHPHPRPPHTHPPHRRHLSPHRRRLAHSPARQPTCPSAAGGVAETATAAAAATTRSGGDTATHATAYSGAVNTAGAREQPSPK